MTDREKAIVMAYTGVCLLKGDKLQIFYEYIEDIMGRPIMTHDIGWLENEIKEKAKADFIALCEDESNSENPNRWIPVSERLPLFRLYKVSDDVLITNGYEIDMGYLVERKGKIFWHYYGGDIEVGIKDEDNDAIAWMPLPKPYKKESEDK